MEMESTGHFPDDPTPRIYEYCVPLTPADFPLPQSPDEDQAAETEPFPLMESPKPSATPETPPESRPFDPSIVVDPRLPTGNFIDLVRQQRFEAYLKQQEEEARAAQAAFEDQIVYKYTLPKQKMEATRRKMLNANAIISYLSVNTSELAHTILLFTINGTMMGNSAGKWTPYDEKKMRSFCAVAAARWREEYNEQTDEERANAPTPIIPAEGDISSLTTEDPTTMSDINKKYFNRLVCRDPEILALRKIEYSDLSTEAVKLDDQNILLWEIKPRLLMAIIGPKRMPKAVKPETEPAATTDAEASTAATNTNVTQAGGTNRLYLDPAEDPYEYAVEKSQKQTNREREENGLKPFTQYEFGRPQRLVGPLAIQRSRAAEMAKRLIQKLAEFEVFPGF